MLRAIGPRLSKRILPAIAAIAVLLAIPSAASARIYSGHCYGDAFGPSYLGSGPVLAAGGVYVTCSGYYWNHEFVVVQGWNGSSWFNRNGGCNWTQVSQGVVATCSAWVPPGSINRIKVTLQAN